MRSLYDGRQLKAARAILGKSVQQVADDIGVNKNTVIRAESYRPIPKHSFSADRLEDYYNKYGLTFQFDNGQATILIDKSLLNRKSLIY